MTPKEARFYRDYGQWVQRERCRVELTQSGLGQLVGLTREAISSMELGHTRTLLHHARAIEGVFTERSLGKGSTFDRAGMPAWAG